MKVSLLILKLYLNFNNTLDLVLVIYFSQVSQGQNLQFPKVFNVCRLPVYIEFTENVTLQVSRCVNYTVH